MSFVWPAMLALLVLVPLLVVAYIALLRRRARRVAELAKKGFVANAATQRLRRRRHVPYAFFLVGLSLAIVALARPQASVSLPKREGTVVLAFDVSNSMRATDLKPTRIEAAKAAARQFVRRQPTSVKIGVVAFSDGGVITQRPTSDRDAVLASLERLRPNGGTSLGQGIFSALNAIAGKPILAGVQVPTDAQLDAEELKVGFYPSAAVVLLTDGENRAEPDPLQVGKLASVAGVKVHAVGVGSTEGGVVEVDGFSSATALNEDLLRALAKATGGKYYAAGDERSLANVYKSIKLEVHSVTERREVSALFTMASMAMLVIGAGFALLWLGRVV